MIYNVDFFLRSAVIAHYLTLGVFAHRNHPVGMLAGESELQVVNLAVYPMVVFRTVEEDEVVDGNYRWATRTDDVQRQLVA